MGALRLLSKFKLKSQGVEKKVIGGGLAEALMWDPNEFGPAPKKPPQPKPHHKHVFPTTTLAPITTLPPPDWRARQAATQWAWEAKVNETRREAAEAAQAAAAALVHQNASNGEESGSTRLFQAQDNKTTAMLNEKIHLLKEGTALLQKKINKKESKIEALQQTTEDLQNKLSATNADEGRVMTSMKNANEPAQRELLSLEYSEMDLLEEATGLQDRLHMLEKAAVANHSEVAVNKSSPKPSDSRLALLEAKLKSIDANNAKLASADAQQQKLLAQLDAKSSTVSGQDRKLTEGRPSLQAAVVHNTRIQKQLTTVEKVTESLQSTSTKLSERQQELGASQLSEHVEQLKKAVRDGTRRAALLQGDKHVWQLQHTQRWAQLIRIQKATRVLAQAKKKLEPLTKAAEKAAENAEHEDLLERAKLRKVAVQLQRELRRAGALL